MKDDIIEIISEHNRIVDYFRRIDYPMDEVIRQSIILQALCNEVFHLAKLAREIGIQCVCNTSTG